MPIPKDITRTIRLTIQYDGTRFVGWQRQPKGESVQGLCEKALSKVANEKVALFGSSRTDAGVHALSQVASFSLKKSKAPVHAFWRGVNSLLPDDIRIIEAKEVDLGFLASRDTLRKTYRYFFYISPQANPIFRHYAWWIKTPLQIEQMNRAASYLVGTHDFVSFRGKRAFTKTSVRTIEKAQFSKESSGLFYFEVCANGFLKYMVRSLVGTLVEVGLGKRSAESLKDVLQAKKRTAAGMRAPANGLFLWSVEYLNSHSER